MNDVYKIETYTAFIRVSGLNLWSLCDCNCSILLRGCTLSKIAQLQSPDQAASFNQSLSLYHVIVEFQTLFLNT